MKTVFYIKNLITNNYIYLNGVEHDDILGAYPFDSREDCVTFLRHYESPFSCFGYYQIIEVIHS